MENDTIFNRIARAPINQEKLNAAKAKLGKLYTGDEEELAVWMYKYVRERGDNSTPTEHLSLHYKNLFDKNPAQWAMVEMAKPNIYGVDQTNNLLSYLENSNDPNKVAIAKVVRDHKASTHNSQYGVLPIEPTPNQALQYLQNNYDPKFGLFGPPGSSNKQHEDWAKALDKVKTSIPHAYSFIFKVLNKPGHKPQRWEAAEDMLRQDKDLWPYYVWSIPGLNKIIPTERPKSSADLARERNEKGFSDEDLNKDVEEGADKLKKSQDRQSELDSAYKAAMKSQSQDSDLEALLASDPDWALTYFQNIMVPRGWKSEVIRRAIEENQAKFDRQDMDEFMHYHLDPSSVPIDKALSRAITYAERNTFYPELEKKFSKDLGSINEYIDKVMIPKKHKSSDIDEALSGYHAGRDLDGALAAAAKYDKELAAKILVARAKEMAQTDPGAAYDVIARWRPHLPNADVAALLAEITQKKQARAPQKTPSPGGLVGPGGAPISYPTSSLKSSILERLGNAWRKL